MLIEPALSLEVQVASSGKEHLLPALGGSPPTGVPEQGKPDYSVPYIGNLKFGFV